MLIAGVQSASASLTGCEGTVYLKLPDSWTAAYTAAGGQFVAFSKSTTYTGWYEISSAKIGGTNGATEFFISKALNDYGQQGGITKTTIGAGVQFAQGSGFSCADFGTKTNELWIQPDFEDPTKPLVQGEPPDVKYFYVFLPDDKIWKSSDPIIVENGKERKMDIDEVCGWYYRRYVNESLPTEVIIRRDDDTALKYAIGMEGEKAYNNGDAATPIDLEGMFDNFKSETGFKNNLFFVADEKKAASLPSDLAGWYVERPAITGNCSYNLAAIIYDTDAKLHPSFSCYGGPSDPKPHDPNPDHDACQNVDQTNAAAGANKAAALKAIYECIGVTPGIVESTLDKTTKKPKLTAAGKKCFIDDKYFDMLFKHVEGVNEVTCFDMPFTRADDGKWEFDSDFFTSPGLKVQGGFYPAEATDALKLEEALPGQTALTAARTKRTAEGPVFYGPMLRELDPVEKIPAIDVLCNGPGWKGGHDCTDLFADGTGTEEFYQGLSPANTGACVFGWSCPDKAPAGWAFFADGTDSAVTTGGSPRWKSEEPAGGRNQHFCFESHAEFRFKPGLKFNFRGDDDIWVFIDNKLAVDLGGTHLAAPAYVDLDTFMPNAKQDSTYDIDIFFCDRRTTMSNVRIKTNMFIEQNNGIDYEGMQNLDEWIVSGDNEYKLCYSQSGAGNCGAVMGSGNTRKCGEELEQDKNVTIDYLFTTDPTGADETQTIISEEQFKTQPVQMGGIFNVTNRARPVINEDKLKESLTPGTYYLRIKIGTDTKTMSWTVKGNVAVATRNAVIMNNGVMAGQLPYVGSKMATMSGATADQMIPIYIGSVIDPCAGAATCSEPVQLIPLPNTEYSLAITDSATGKDYSKKATVYEMKNGQLSIVSAGSTRKLGASGIDTLYVTIPFAEMDSRIEKLAINVKQSNLKAYVSFFAPSLVFVKSETSLEPAETSKDTTFMKGSPALFYVVAVDPITNSLCSTCNFPLTSGSQTSSGLNLDATISIVDGRALVTVISQKEYYRCSDGRADCPGAATLHLTGPSVTLMQATYPNLLFQEPPVPTPQFADIYDVHGELPTTEMNVDAPYFSMQTEYLDGIGDSLVVYYARNFYNHPDSLPGKIAVYWDEDVKDSVVFEKDEILAGTHCGAAAGLDDTLCLKRITLGGKKFSKKVKTSGVGKLRSWATYTARGVTVTTDYPCSIYDRIAPIIIGARAKTEASGETVKLTIQFSEPIQKSTDAAAEGDKMLSFFINNGKATGFYEHIPLLTGTSFPEGTTNENLTLLYSQKNSSGVFPQSGDYMHFRHLMITDQSDYMTYPGADTIRPADDASYKWNIATGYDPLGSGRKPSPWALISGEVSVYAVRLIPEAKGGVPKTPNEIANLDVMEVFTYDAAKDDEAFRKDIRAGQGEFEKYGFIPHGWYVKSDMGALIESDEQFVNANRKNVFFEYELQFFSNLGSFVASQKGRVYCDDDENLKNNRRYYFGGAGHNCVDNRKNFFIVWNMKSKQNRLVGSGAYITKLKSFVQLDNFGKKNKLEKSEMWGVRHNAKTIGSFPSLLP